MKIKINKWLCPPHFIIVLFGTIYVRSQQQYDKVVQPYSYYYNHELIHSYQAKGNWVWFYIKYILYYLKHLHWIIYNLQAPYKFHPMELEAYKNQCNFNYIFEKDAGIQYKKYRNIKTKNIKKFYKDNLNYYTYISTL